MFKIFLLTLRSTFRPAMAAIVILCALLTLVCLGLFITATAWITDHYVVLQNHWLDSGTTLLGGLAGTVAAWFMIPAFMVLFAGLFQERIIVLTERRYYPDRAGEPSGRIWPDLLHDLRFTAQALLLNVLILPLYLFGIGFPASVLLNSYLLGREFFETAAGYHLGKPEARRLGRAHARRIYASGLVFTLLSLVPLVNLVMPVVATVWMVHLYQWAEGR